MQSPPGILIAGHTGRLSDVRLRIQASKLALLLICVFFFSDGITPSVGVRSPVHLFRPQRSESDGTSVC